MDKTVKVSIVVPVYNVENYLEACLDSILRQSLKEIEIICVNDGSKDRSGEILNRYARQDSRVVILDRENGGYGSAMNWGMNEATGEYIGIVEPDDCVSPQMFEELYECAREYDLDWVKEDFYRFKTVKGKTSREYIALSPFAEDYNQVFKPKEKKESFDFVMNTWSGIYRSAFLRKHQIRHNETPGASFQDNGFWFQTFLYAERTMILDRPGYWCRRDNPNSSIRNSEKVYAINQEYDFIRGILTRDPDMWEEWKGVYWRRRFMACDWTLHRIDGSFVKDYLHTVSEELKSGLKNSEFSKTDFEEAEWIRVQQRMKESFVKPEDLEGKLLLVENSRSYKLGRAITAVPRIIRNALHHS